MTNTIKATFQNGKGSARHNDRTYEKATEEEKEEVILSWKQYSDAKDFQESELKFFETAYGKWLEDQNAKFKKLGQKDRIKEMADILGKPNLLKKKGRYEPTETILQIGRADQEINGSYDTLKACVFDYIKAIQKKYGANMRILDFAIHKEDAYHVHIRRSWFIPYYDKDGVQVGFKPAKDEALQALGFELPDPTKKKDRYNNRTMVQTNEERELWYDILQEHGIIVDREANKEEADKLSRRKAKKLIDKVEEEADRKIKSIKENVKNTEKLAEKQIENAIQKANYYENALENAERLIEIKQKKLQKTKEELYMANKELEEKQEKIAEIDRNFYGTKGENNLDEWLDLHR